MNDYDNDYDIGGEQAEYAATTQPGMDVWLAGMQSLYDEDASRNRAMQAANPMWSLSDSLSVVFRGQPYGVTLDNPIVEEHFLPEMATRFTLRHFASYDWDGIAWRHSGFVWGDTPVFFHSGFNNMMAVRIGHSGVIFTAKKRYRTVDELFG